MPEETTTPNAEQATETTATAQSSAGTSNTETQAEPMIPKARFDEVNNRLKALEAEAAKNAKAQAAEDERLKIAQGEWQKLAESHKARVEELTPKAELAEELTQFFNDWIEEQTSTWPKELEGFKGLDPGASASIKQRQAWLREGSKLATELLGDKTPTPGNGRRPRPTGQTQPSGEPALQRRDTDNIYQPF